MNIKSKLGRFVGIAATVMICWLSLAGIASAHPAQAHAIPTTGTTTGCAIQTFNGHFLTAVNGGGGTINSILTNETSIRSWEKFSLIGLGTAGFVIRTSDNRHFLTAVGGGGFTNTEDAVHTNATVPSSWENFRLYPLSTGPNQYAIRTINGYYLTAVDGGGRTTETIHTNALSINGWECFTITCGH